jgi:hypothetical protein
MIKFELTDDEATTILIALDNYREIAEREFHHSGDEEDQEQAGSAEWCWQKLFCAQQKFRNSIADAVGEGELPTNESTSSVDPYDLKGLEY